MGSDRLRSSRVSSVPPSETQVTNTGSFVVCCGIANESAEALTTPFTGSRCLGFEFEITERQPFGIGIPWFQAYLDGGVATRPFTLNGPAGTRCRPIRQTVRARYGIDCHHRRWQ